MSLGRQPRQTQERARASRTPPAPNPAADAPRTHCRSPRALSPGLRPPTATGPRTPRVRPHASSCWRRTRCAQAAQDQGVRPGLFSETAPETAARGSTTRTYSTPLRRTQTCSTPGARPASVAQWAAARADSSTVQISREKGSKSRESRDETHNGRWGRRKGRALENVGPSGGRTGGVEPREKLGVSLVLWLLRFNTDYSSSIGLSSFLGQSSLEATI